MVMVVVVLLGMLLANFLRSQSILGEVPYMDEIFHVGQAQAYCRGEYGVWDPKITTYPGVYLLSSGLHRLWDSRSTARSSCSLGELRFVNILLVVVTYMACVMFRRRVEPEVDAHLNALLIVMYPLSVFYYSLYYTDTASTCSLVLTYYFATQRHPKVSQVALFILSSAAIAVRQTNAVWVLFVIGTNMLQQLQDLGKMPPNASADQEPPYLNQLVTFVRALLSDALMLLRCNVGLLCSVLWFCIAVLRTGGVVVGDKENHHPVLHLAMPLHLCAVAAAMKGTWGLFGITNISSPKGVYTSPGWRDMCFHALLIAAVSAALVFGSFEHPFLLSDNRHYTFYLWKRALRFPTTCLLLGPPYYLCLLFVKRCLSKGGCSSPWITIFAVACILSLAPTPLLEPRYWTPGIVVFLLNAPAARLAWERYAVAASVAVCIAVNAGAQYVFLERPFRGVDGAIARFMP